MNLSDAPAADEVLADEPATAEPASEVPVSPSVVRAPSNDPLHGVTLEAILNTLVAEYGWDELGGRIRINCFVSDPSVKSSLKFLRKTPWARQKVEALYVSTMRDRADSQ